MKRFFLILTILLLILNNDSFSQTVIKMKRDGGISIIPCKVNGLSLNFIFDTGASDVSLSMTEATFMLKNDYLSVKDIIGSNKFTDANGNINEGVIINLKEIEIAGLMLYNVKASVVKNNIAPLLLGQSAIRKLGKIQLDFEQNTLTILSGKGSFDFSNKNHQIQQSTNNRRQQTNQSVTGNLIKFEDLEVAEHEFPNEMDWESAKAACAALGNGWKLPTKEELDILYQNKVKIGDFSDDIYWSSTEFNSDRAWNQNFTNGELYDFSKSLTFKVRAIRAIDRIEIKPKSTSQKISR